MLIASESSALDPRWLQYLALVLFALFVRSSLRRETNGPARPVLVFEPARRLTAGERTRTHPALDRPALDALLEIEFTRQPPDTKE